MGPFFVNTDLNKLLEHQGKTCSQIHCPLLGNEVDHGIVVVLARLASICSLTGRYDNPMSLSALSPQSETMNWPVSSDTPWAPRHIWRDRSPHANVVIADTALLGTLPPLHLKPNSLSLTGG
jgi:hypothetical protein